MEKRMNILSFPFLFIVSFIAMTGTLRTQDAAPSQLQWTDLPDGVRIRLSSRIPAVECAMEPSSVAAGMWTAFAPRSAPAATEGARKSPLLGVLYSLLLPGLGEVYAGRQDRMIYPLISEAVLWLGVAGFNAYGNSIQHDARLFAQVHAGVNQAGKNDQFFVDIGNYTDIYQYNDYKLVDRNLPALYDVNNPSFYWKWDSDADRILFKDRRIKSDQMFNAVSFFIAGLVANRIWSAVESALFIRDYNKGLEHTGLLPSMQPELMTLNGRLDGLRFQFSQSF